MVVTLLWLLPYGGPYGAWGDFIVVVTLWGTPWLWPCCGCDPMGDPMGPGVTLLWL